MSMQVYNEGNLLCRLEENDKLVLTPFEKNIDIWRQHWRVLERSDLVSVSLPSLLGSTAFAFYCF
jgi:hypothetical protein